MLEFENIYNMINNKVKVEYENFKDFMSKKSQMELMNSAYRIYMFSEIYNFLTIDAEQIDEYFIDYQRGFMRKNKSKIMMCIKEMSILEDIYWFFCNLDELTAPTYDNIAWAFIEVLGGIIG